MNYHLLLPLAVLSIVSFVAFFIERFAIEREIAIASGNEDKLDATLRLLKRDVGDVSLGAASVFIPFIILTILGSVPKWIVFGAWYFVFSAIIRLPLVHFTRGRDASSDEKTLRRFVPLMPLIMLNIPLIVVLYGYTLYEAFEAL